MTLRADSGFYARKVVDACRNANVRFAQAWANIPLRMSPGEGEDVLGADTATNEGQSDGSEAE